MTPHFTVHWDSLDGDLANPNSSGWLPAVRFHCLDAHVMLAAHDEREDGTFLLHRAQVVLWRNLTDNTLALAFLDREAQNDQFPELIIPLGIVYEKKVSLQCSGSGLIRGKMVLKTATSLAMSVTTKPTKITVYLRENVMNTLDAAMEAAVQKWPNQQELTIHPI
jgi:hypothetical protein